MSKSINAQIEERLAIDALRTLKTICCRYWNFVTVAWNNNFFDYLALKNGCVFRTHQEAHDARMTKYKELTGKEW